ncbi:MAG: hypothetical protein KF851_04995 [Pirellulaceae bacterium]|nr:hypothetical protein [Pirellulaceae bacterium]
MKLRHRLCGRLPSLVFALILFGVIVMPRATAIGQEEMSRPEKQFIKQLQTEIEKVSTNIDRSRGPQAQRAYEGVLKRLQNAPPNSSPLFKKELDTELKRLADFQKKLGELGIEVDAPNAPSGDMNTSSTEISFKDAIAPILVAKCGNCHVRRSRGEFGMANYQSLAQSGMVVPGDPVSSRLIQVIDTGSMPQGNLTVSADELTKLRNWISAGAKNDAANDESLLGLVADDRGTNRPAEPLQVKQADGTQTVSFAREIAPIIASECRGCHVEANRPRGGLNMDSFTTFLRGGDSGALIVPGKSAESLLVKKLSGTADGNRMPAQRPPLPQNQVDLIKRWIDEGAPFDGTTPTLPLKTIAATAKASVSSHEELSTERKKVAEENWDKALPNIPNNHIDRDEFRVFSSLSDERLTAVTDKAEQLVEKIKRQLGLSKNEPLVKGKLTLYVFERRYDFNELSTMVEGYPLPKETKSMWKNSVVDVYVAIAMDRTVDFTAIEPELCRVMTAASVSAWAQGIPVWFADGAGYSTSERLFPKSDEVKLWKQGAESSLAKVTNVDDFAGGKLSRELTGLAGFQLVSAMRTQEANFKRLTAELSKGTEFSTAFSTAFKRDIESWLAGMINTRAGGR